MSDTPKKRPWFQFHLSTAVVLMFVAAGLLWLNMGPRVAIHWTYYIMRLYGWPFRCYEITVYKDPTFDAKVPEGVTNWWALGIDVGTFILILVATCFVCERLIRRQERRP